MTRATGMPAIVGAALLSHQTSFTSIYEVSTVVCVLLFGGFAFATAPNDLVSIAKCIGIGTAVAPFAAACFSVPIWLVLKVAG
jgi:hypothetical protein